MATASGQGVAPPAASRPDRERFAAALLGACIVVAPQLIGGVAPWAMLVTCAMALVALAVLLSAGTGPSLPVPRIVYAMLLPLAWTIVQALPLPCGLIAAVSPEAVERLADAHAILGLDAPVLCTLSMDPGSTREEVVKGFAINAVFLAALWASARGLRRWVYRAVAASAVLLALVALGHAAVDAERVFGAYEPIEVSNHALLAPVLNLNSLGGFLAMAIPVLIALAVGDRHAGVRAVMLVGVGVLATTALMTGSRGAVGAVVMGVGLYALLALRSRRHVATGGSTVTRLAIPAAIALLLGATGYAFHEAVVQQFAEEGWSKLAHIERCLGFAIGHAWTGVGRGAFAAVFASAAPSAVRYDFVESFPVQWAVDWGVPVTILAMGGIAPALLAQLVRPASRRRLGAAVGVLAVATQNLVDLGLELLGVAVVASALLASATAPSRRSASSMVGPLSGRRLGWLLVAGGALALVLLGPQLPDDHTLALDRELRARLASPDRASFHSILTRATLLHPSEPLFAVLGANEAQRHADRSAGRWINRAMRLAPGWSAPHLQAAQWLWSVGRRDQAIVELREAASLVLHDVDGVLCPVARAEPGKIVNAAPHGQGRQRFLELAASCLDAKSESGARFDAALREHHADLPFTALRRAQRVARGGDLDAARRLLEQLTEAHPDYLDAIRARVWVTIEAGAPTAAIAYLKQAAPRAPRVALLPLEAQAEGAAGNLVRMREAIGQLKARNTSNSRQLAKAYMLEASLERKFGDRALALTAYQEAYRINNDISALRSMARVAEELGDSRLAAQALGSLCARSGGEGPDCQRLRTLRP